MDDNEVDRAAKNPRHTAWVQMDHYSPQEHYEQYQYSDKEPKDLIILGLSYEAKEEDVREHFSSFGEVDFVSVSYCMPLLCCEYKSTYV